MIREIGSEFNIESVIGSGIRGCIHRGYVDHVYTRSGREAIGFILDELTPNRRIAALPAYICEAMLQPFLSRGYSIEYFGVDESFNPNIDGVKAALSKEPDILLVIDWFGMKKNEEVVSIARKHRGDIVVLVDCTHSFFHDSVISGVDYVVASLRKWLPLPDGAIAASCKQKFKNELEHKDSRFTDLRKNAMTMKTDYLATGRRALKVEYRRVLQEAELLLACGDEVYEMSPFSLFLLSRMDWDDMRTRRCQNFNALYRSLTNRASAIVVPIVDSLATELECPFSFPILVANNRDELQAWLAEHGIYCPVLWPLPQCAYGSDRVSAYLSDSMLSIPCDQRYSVDDMEHIVDVLCGFATC